MAKKSLIFIVMVAVSVVVILCLVGWAKVNQKNELERRIVRKAISRKLEKVRIAAVEEKVLLPNKKPTPASKPVVLKAKTSKPKPFKKKVAAKKKSSQRLLPANFRLDNHMIHVGRQLIDKNSSIPIVQASYKRIGFEHYLKKMKDMGGRLFVGDASKQRILAEVIVGNHSGRYRFSGLDEGKKDELDGMALFRPREISGEPLVNEILNYAWRFFKHSDLRSVILLPLDKEAAILGALKEYLNTSGYHISQFDIVWGEYFQEGRQFGLKVEKGRISKTGEIVYLDMILSMQGGPGDESKS